MKFAKVFSLKSFPLYGICTNRYEQSVNQKQDWMLHRVIHCSLIPRLSPCDRKLGGDWERGYHHCARQILINASSAVLRWLSDEDSCLVKQAIRWLVLAHKNKRLDDAQMAQERASPQQPLQPSS